jgi:hypothetical protein
MENRLAMDRLYQINTASQNVERKGSEIHKKKFSRLETLTTWEKYI